MPKKDYGPGTCECCGKEFIRKSNKKQRFCSRECVSKYASKTRWTRRAITAEPGREPDCNWCEYGLCIAGYFWACNYLEVEGHRRPCPSMYSAGECACFKPLTPKGAKTNGHKKNRNGGDSHCDDDTGDYRLCYHVGQRGKRGEKEGRTSE